MSAVPALALARRLACLAPLAALAAAGGSYGDDVIGAGMWRHHNVNQSAVISVIGENQWPASAMRAGNGSAAAGAVAAWRQQRRCGS